ncbi:MAG: NADH-quinone oxidoreductase subunit F [Limnohabitans sp.]|nr:NADH-quinone oxidoreductase subunit F [Limnohabitans sp.]
MSKKIQRMATLGVDRKRHRKAPKGRCVDSDVLIHLQHLLGETPKSADQLIEYLHEIQDHMGYLPVEYLTALAQEMGLPQTHVYEVATFYHHFDVVKESDTAPPALTVRVCDGISCEMAGSSDLLKKIYKLLGTHIRVIPAPCVGRCDHAPVAVVGQVPVHQATEKTIQATVDAGRFVDEHTQFLSFDDYKKSGGYELLKSCINSQHTRNDIITCLEQSGLRGLGGAGFPLGRKWRIVSLEPAPRLMAVNIDEGEPGTFKDRVLLERDPHRFLEGMLIAAWAVGIPKIYIYLRDEYHGCRVMLDKQIKLLRRNPPMADMPEIILRRGAGAYICGEESSMIESIEGKRGMPRLRPPFVAQVGLFGRPTLEHNFESLFWVREIIEKGADWFSSHGKNNRKGLRTFSVSGRVKQPGIKLAPAGITIQELIDEHCGGMLEGHRFYAYLPGGASGGILPATLNNIPLDFDTLQAYGCFIGSAAVVVLSDQDSVTNAARNLMNFFKNESCGQCTPCRVGTAKAYALITKPSWDLPLLGELSQVMRDASICGLGQAAPNAVDCVVKYFPQELKKSGT